MYLLKEDLRQIWSWGSYKEGQMALNNWLITAQQS
jgi:hypothetical protein